ncbi:aldo/keto reductase [Fictibacillus nanhaiensis]|uniref:aldo/keto reductase n=1 Tax=Fictibacillus nanhaiensis TaxID=742169 RepID=UPI002041FC60|nr:aldo/keto reductase [Fictibacillus nanhaiensis]MCM3731928.1 aldo/keto reductase [Fictibacillus nanhaiensis]
MKSGLPWFDVSQIAIGTHLGDMTTDDSSLYQKSIEFALKNGINFIDTALNYRGMRSERDIGIVLSKLIHAEKRIKREEVIISTKAGIIPGDIDLQIRPESYLKEKLLNKGILQEEDLQIINQHKHVLTPSYYEFAIKQSLKHMNLDTIDIHYIHNPEISRKVLGEEKFYKDLEKLFRFYEDQVERGTIQFYGLSLLLQFLRYVFFYLLHVRSKKCIYAQSASRFAQNNSATLKLCRSSLRILYFRSKSYLKTISPFPNTPIILAGKTFIPLLKFIACK